MVKDMFYMVKISKAVGRHLNAVQIFQLDYSLISYINFKMVFGG